MTQRLYYTDAYLDTFQARVEEIAPDGLRVYLDRTAFYPTSGGQPFDTGTLGGAAVVDVVDVVDEGERIAHVLAEPASGALAVGAEVEGRIDRGRRFDHMQQHTGQHLLSALLHERWGWATTSVHFGDETNTLDLDVESIPPETIAEVERAANEVVYEDRPLSVAFEDAAEAGGLRRASERTGTLRIVTIEGIDRSACGGTHVRSTGEIGTILLRRVERVRKSVRLEFVCGGRAVRRARADFEALSRIAGALSTSLDDAPAVVAGQTGQLREAASVRKQMREELAALRARALADAAASDGAGVRWIVERRPAWDADELRALAHAVAALPRAVLVAAVESPPTVMLAASEDSGVNAGAALKSALAAAGGRGGGSPRVAQGSVPDAAALDTALDALRPR